MREKMKDRGITLIALVVTIIVLLILARRQYQYVDWGEWDFEESCRGERKERKCTTKRKNEFKRI